MIRSRLLAALALALLPAAALAQDTAPATGAPATEAPATEAPAADTVAPPAGDLSLGETVNGEPQVGDTYVADVQGDWEVRCVRTEDGKDPCQLYQLLQDEAGNAVAEIGMFALPEGQQAAAGATIITPLETLLMQQVTIAVDGGTAKRYPFTFCSQIGCFARVGFTADEVAAFKRGRQATLTIFPAAAPDQPVNLTISLSGFTAGYDAVAAANADNG
ncbi:MAG: invasion associated locus B family protein [Rhodobacteraceae bacterium]|jgi:invasion protein IalB|nr:invasion associated locus B family protein [Paracoccaceae bacterium]